MNAAIALSELGLPQPDASTLDVVEKRKMVVISARDSGEAKKSRQDECKPSVRDASTACVADAAKKSQDVLMGAASAAPKLGDVEQFSTETQTQEVGLFSAETQTCATDLDSILLGSRPNKDDSLGLEREDSCASSSSLLDDSIRHMETQFDLDDILCSNYTQTSARMSSSILPMDAASAVCSIETQTMDFMFEDEEFAGGRRNIETAHSHTQT